MIERKNIDRVFQENLKDFEIFPSKKVWNNLEIHLNNNHKKKIIPLWQRLGGIAMIFTVLFAGGVWYYNLNSISPNSIEKTVLKTKFKNSDNKEIIPVFQKTEISQKNLIQSKRINTKTIANEKEKSIFVKNPNNNVIITSTNINSIYKNIENKYIINKNDFIESLNSNENLISNIEPININDEKIVSNNKKWSIGPTVAPVYYNTLQSGSPLNENLSQNSKSSDDALSVGIKLNYQLTNKINIQSGINKVELAYNTKNVNALVSTSKFASNNINTSKPGITLLTNSGNQIDFQSSSDDRSKSSLYGDLNQSIEYFELPLEMKYNFYDTRVGLSLVGGFSTFILTKNSVSIISQNQITDLGEANNLNNFNFSGNLGVDLDYKINKSWYLNVSPMVKYQFNTYSHSSGNFQPYYFGIYSGLNYKF